LDHVPDRLVGVVRVELGALVRLHDAGVVHAAGGGGGFYFGAAVGLRKVMNVSGTFAVMVGDGETNLLQDGGEDEAVVYEGDFCAVLDCVVDALDLVVTRFCS
jgi:hypothetical protein